MRPGTTPDEPRRVDGAHDLRATEDACRQLQLELRHPGSGPERLLLHLAQAQLLEPLVGRDPWTHRT